MKEIARSAIVEHSASEMYALVDDIDSYPRFLPWCLEARVQAAGTRKRATLTAGVGGIRQSFTTENENLPDRAIDMRLVEGPFRDFAAALLVVDDHALARGIHRGHACAALQLAQIALRLLAIGALRVRVRAFLRRLLVGFGAL